MAFSGVLYSALCSQNNFKDFEVILITLTVKGILAILNFLNRRGAEIFIG